MKLFLVLLFVPCTVSLRLSVDAHLASRHAEDDSADDLSIDIGMMKFESGKPMEKSFFRYRHTDGPIKATKGHYGGTKTFLEHLTKDLSSEMNEKLKKCKAKGKGMWHHNKEDHSPDVWIIFNAEDQSADELAKIAPDKSLLLGPGLSESKMETTNLQGKKNRNLFIPFASLMFAESHDHSPLELMNRTRAKESLKQKSNEKTLLYQQGTCYKYRDNFFDIVCDHLEKKGKSCHYNSNCHGGQNHAKYSHNKNGRSSPYDGGAKNYSPFKFALSMEHKPTSYGYITEKIVIPLLAGTIPIYAGASQITEVFDPLSFIHADVSKDGHGGKSALREVDKLLENPKLYEEMVSRPAVSEESFRKYFTWHADTWEQYGDDTRQRILNALVSIC